jgi:hypothetical protein
VAARTVTPPDAPLDDPRVGALLDLWRSVLAEPGLRATDNFFLSGGHSLLAFELAERISAELGQQVSFEMIFQDPTPARLAARIGDGQ